MAAKRSSFPRSSHLPKWSGSRDYSAKPEPLHNISSKKRGPTPGAQRKTRRSLEILVTHQRLELGAGGARG